MAERLFLPQSSQVITEEGFGVKREAKICLSTRETTQARWPCSGKLEDTATWACAPHWKGDVGTRDGAVDGDSHKITPALCSRRLQSRRCSLDFGSEDWDRLKKPADAWRGFPASS